MSEAHSFFLLGRFRFFPNRQELRLDDASPRLLSHCETELLALLASPPNANVTRKDILDRLWGNDSFFNSRNLDVYVSKLRDTEAPAGRCGGTVADAEGGGGIGWCVEGPLSIMFFKSSNFLTLPKNQKKCLGLKGFT